MEELYCGHLKEVFNIDGPEYLYFEDYEEDIFQRPSIPGAFSGKNHTEETKELMRRPKSKEHVRKVRDAIKAKWDSGDYDRETYRKRELGKKMPEETRRKIAETMARRWEERRLTNPDKEYKIERRKNKFIK